MAQPAQSGSAASASSAATDSHPRRWAILAVVGMAQFMVMLDATVVNVALPSIRVDLGATTGELQWVVDAYVLMLGSLLLFGGRLADILGRRQVFLAGLALFTAASLVCGFAGSGEVLIAARVAQGLGAALLSPSALSIVVTAFRDMVERRTAMTVWAALAAIGGTLGVVLGGALMTAADWRWAFWVNLPIAAVTAVAAVRLVPALRPPADAPRRSLDLPGAALAAAALALLIYGLIHAGEHGWGSPATYLPVVAAAVLFVVLGVLQARGADPLIPPRLLAVGTLAAASVGLLLVSALMMSVFFMTSVYQQQVLGFNPLEAGLGVVGMGLPTLVMSVLIPKMMGRLGPQRVYLLGAVLLTAGSLLLVWLPTADGSYFTGLLPGLAVMGFGLPCCFAPLNTLGVSSVRPVESGVASGVLTTFNQTGAALGMATVVTLATSRARVFTADGDPSDVALTSGFQVGYLALAGIAVASVVLALNFLARRARTNA